MTIAQQAEELSHVPQSFQSFLETRGIVYDPLTQLDLLASALSSQFVLFAGPSGTGKSTAAKILAEFMTGTDRRRIVDARRSWTSPEDIAGQYSVFAGGFVSGPYTDCLVELSNSQNGSPFITVEEANLSSIEGYLGPVVTASSSVAFRELLWPLHSAGPETGPVPRKLRIGPWPRVLGTINVDSTAEAPAPKVSGRACVVLLEPPSVDTALISTDALSDVVAPKDSPGSALIGDPRRAWSNAMVNKTTGQLTDALKPLLETLQASAGNGFNVVTPRDVQRCVLYMSWHVALTEAAIAAETIPAGTPIHTQSAENSILHFVLPGLASEQFGRALQPLVDNATDGGLLATRLKRLQTGGESLFGVLPDFWASLS